MVLFVGSGLSHLAPAKDGSSRRIPLWAGLTEAIAERFGLNLSDFNGSPLDLFDAVTVESERRELEKAIREELNDKDFSPSSAHKALADLPWHKIVTTNYDKLLSKVVREQYPIADEEDYIRLKTAKVIQIHGNFLKPHTLTREDYRLWGEKHRIAYHTLVGFFLHKSILFVGYSLNDPHVDEILALVRNWAGEDRGSFFGLFWKLPQAMSALLGRRDKINAVSIEAEEEWASAFLQIKLELQQFRYETVTIIQILLYHLCMPSFLLKQNVL